MDADEVVPGSLAALRARVEAVLLTAWNIRLSILAIGDEINRHLCCQGAGRIIAALSFDVFERTVQAYAELGGEWFNYVASNQE